MAGQKRQAKNGEQNDTSKRSVHEEHTSAFEKFWEACPNKVGRKACLTKWKSMRLDADISYILHGLERWKASDRWKRGYVADPLTFLNQERWKDVPPAAPSQAKGELRVGDLSPEQKAEARRHVARVEEFFRLGRLPENNRKSDDEIWAMIQTNEK
jgi:hypothetical protein